MAQPKVFVSHSSKDTAFAERLVLDLRMAGAHAWLDKEDLGAGNFQRRINDALENCEWFVLVLTRNALSSPWVQQEVDAANRLKHQGRIRDLIFIQAGPVEHREVPPLLGVYIVFDAVTDYSGSVNRTLKAIGIAQPSMPTWLTSTHDATPRFPRTAKVCEIRIRRVESLSFVEVCAGPEHLGQMQVVYSREIDRDQLPYDRKYAELVAARRMRQDLERAGWETVARDPDEPFDAVSTHDKWIWDYASLERK